jgi:hypothetical protein
MSNAVPIRNFSVEGPSRNFSVVSGPCSQLGNDLKLNKSTSLKIPTQLMFHSSLKQNQQTPVSQGPSGLISVRNGENLKSLLHE